MNTQTSVGRLNITLPAQTLAALEAIVPERRKSSFIAQAIEEKLERERWQTAFDRLSALPPTLTQISNPVEWVEELRREDEYRLGPNNV